VPEPLPIPHASKQQHNDEFDTLDPYSRARKATNLTEDGPNIGSQDVYLNLVEWISFLVNRHTAVSVGSEGERQKIEQYNPSNSLLFLLYQREIT
jgi:hypothetical protein